MNGEPKQSWPVISERDFRDSDREYFHTESDIRTCAEPQFQFISHDRSENRSNSGWSNYDNEPTLERNFSIVNNKNFRILNGARIEMPRESRYDILHPDVHGDGYEIDEKEPYLLLPVGYEYEENRWQKRKKRGYGLVLKQEQGNTSQWQRVGLMVSRFY